MKNYRSLYDLLQWAKPLCIVSYKDTEMTYIKQVKRENWRANLFTKKKGTRHTYVRQQQTTILDFVQAHTECSGVKIVSWRQNPPINGQTVHQMNIIESWRKRLNSSDNTNRNAFKIRRWRVLTNSHQVQIWEHTVTDRCSKTVATTEKTSYLISELLSLNLHLIM